MDNIKSLNIFLDKIVEIKVALFGGGHRIAIGRVFKLDTEDIVLRRDDRWGRQCIDYRDILEIKVVEVTPDSMYEDLTS